MSTERCWLALALVIVVPTGFLVKFHIPGGFGWWCCLYGAAILYEVFWVLVLRFWFSKLSPRACAVIVLAITSILEVLQLWHPAWLDGIRSTFWGGVLLGTTFDGWDFIHYVIGVILGAVLAGVIARSTREGRHATMRP